MPPECGRLLWESSSFDLVHDVMLVRYLSREAVEVGQKLIKKKFPEFTDRIMFVHANAAFLPFKNGVFCVAQALASIHHSGHLDDCASELARVTKKMVFWRHGFMPKVSLREVTVAEKVFSV